MAKKWLVMLFSFVFASFPLAAQEEVKSISSINNVSLIKNEANAIEIEFEIQPSGSGYDVSRILQTDKSLKIELKNVSLGEGALDQLYQYDNTTQYGSTYYRFYDKAVKSMLVHQARDDLVLIEFEHTAQPVAYLVNQFDNKLLIHIEPAAEKQERISGYYEKEALRDILVDTADASNEQIFVIDEASSKPRLWLSNMPQSKVTEVISQANGLKNRQFNSISFVAPEDVLQRIESKFSAKKWNTEKISLLFRDVEFKALLSTLMYFADQTLVTTQADLGNMGVRLMDISWSQAFDYVIASKDGLVTKEIDGILVVAYPQEIELAQERGCFKAILAQQASSETVVKLEHIQADDIYPKIQDLLDSDMLKTQICEGLEGGFLRANWIEGNQISFKASAETTKRIKQLVQEMDQPASHSNEEKAQ